jgi:hypothetical protein
LSQSLRRCSRPSKAPGLERCASRHIDGSGAAVKSASAHFGFVLVSKLAPLFEAQQSAGP